MQKIFIAKGGYTLKMNGMSCCTGAPNARA